MLKFLIVMFAVLFALSVLAATGFLVAAVLIQGKHGLHVQQAGLICLIPAFAFGALGLGLLEDMPEGAIE